MVIGMEYGDIASWWYEGSRAIDLAVTERRELIPFLKMIRVTAKILEEFRLLTPETIMFEDWVKFDYTEQKIIRVTGPDMCLESIDGWNVNDLPELILSRLDDEFNKSYFLYPLEIKILGKGSIIDANGRKSEWPNVSWIHGISFGTHVIQVCTQSYAWMPFDLSGNAQSEMSKYNAPRLKEALRKISDILEVSPIAESDSDYAVINGYNICNRLDADGEPIPINIE